MPICNKCYNKTIQVFRSLVEILLQCKYKKVLFNNTAVQIFSSFALNLSVHPRNQNDIQRGEKYDPTLISL